RPSTPSRDSWRSSPRSFWRCPGCCTRSPHIRSSPWETSAAMRGELVLSISTLLGFILTLIRVGGVFIFVPLPGITAVLSPARIILSLGITIALFPEWPRIAATPSAGLFLLWVLVEAGLGLGIGLTVAFISES